ncbi:GreA/GreB family elongation factor [Patescibacteria group bacterium]|nr:GreA/GreB family elongation factor [Patescibacteria group bacterium]
MPLYACTKYGLDKIRKAIATAQTNIDSAISMKADSGSSQDGWHDEGFKQGVSEELTWSRRIGELQGILRQTYMADIIETDDVAGIGNGLIITLNGAEKRFILEGYLLEADEKRVSIYSPLGKLLLGAKEGEEKVLVIGKKESRIIIKKILRPSNAESIFSRDTLSV